MRKRPFAQKVEDSHSTEEESAAQVCRSACLSLWDTFVTLDHKFTTHLAVCASRSSPLGHLRPLMKILEISCHGVPWIVGAVIMFLCSHKPQDVEVSVNLFLALLFDLIVVGLLKMTFRRSRPSHNVMDMFVAPFVDKFSFPSGHATRAAMMCFFICYHLLISPLYIVLTWVWAICVSISRILLGRHHIFDVVCGLCIGMTSYYAYLYMWVSQETCLTYLDTYFGHVHL